MNSNNFDWQSDKSIVECNRFMLENSIATDVTFLVGESRTKFSAHKYVLISRSPVFYAMFEGPLAESDEIPIPDVYPATFECLLRYLYCDEVSVSVDTVLPVLYAAKKYNVQRLVEKCVEKLEDSLSTDNVCIITEYAHFFDETQLHSKCLRFINEHGESVLRHDDFKNLCAKCTEQIVSCDELEAKETTVFEGVLQWSKAQCQREEMEVNEQNIRAVLKDILCHVRFSTMNIQYFCDKVVKAGILSDGEKLEIFHNFCSDNKHSLPFDTAPRKRPMTKFCRFQEIQKEETWTYSCGWRDAISFRCDKNIVLCGFLLYRSYSGRGEYNVSYTIYEGVAKTVASGDIQVSSETTSTDLELMFSEHVPLKANVTTSLVLSIKGPNSIHGQSGVEEITCDNVVFRFTESPWSDNGTNIDRGQIPGLVFYFEGE